MQAQHLESEDIGELTVQQYAVFFFFSSRRRHTRLQGDWSSDVCSSDLHAQLRATTSATPRARARRRRRVRAPTIRKASATTTTSAVASRAARRRRGAFTRSGEGRVGEEWRSRWAPDHLKKKKQPQQDRH